MFFGDELRFTSDDYDLAGFAVGAVERTHLLPRSDMKAGDVLLALPSSGPHSNGFSLIRKIVTLSGLDLQSPAPWEPSSTVGDALLTPTRIYIKQLLPGIKAGLFKGMSHITGGGFMENIPRIFSAESGLGVRIDCTTWELPGIWRWLMKAGGVSAAEMARTFNCGVGMVIVLGRKDLDAAVRSLRENGEEGVFVMGEVLGRSGVKYTGMERWEV